MEVRQPTRAEARSGEQWDTALATVGQDLTPQGPALCALRIHPPLQSNWRGDGGNTTYTGTQGAVTRERGAWG